MADPTVNAFALPGGYVGINTGLILLTQSESELAAVLAHEITHVTQRHMARSVSGQQRGFLYMLAALAVAIAASRSNSSSSGQATSAALASAQALAIQNQINYTREHEFEADRIGIPAPRRRRLRRHRDGDDDGTAAEIEPVLRRQRAVLSALAPDHLRAHRRGAGPGLRQGLPAGDRLDRLPSGARVAAQLYRDEQGSRGVLSCRARRPQVQRRSRGALRPRRVAAAQRGVPAGHDGTRGAGEDRPAAPDDRGDGRSRADGIGQARSRHRRGSRPRSSAIRTSCS